MGAPASLSVRAEAVPANPAAEAVPANPPEVMKFSERWSRPGAANAGLITGIGTGSSAGTGEGALAVGGDERPRVRAEVGDLGAEAQRRLSAVREVMTSLQPGAAREPEDLLGTLEREGITAVEPVAGERPAVLIPGAGWSACARLLAAHATTPVVVRAHPDGWRVTAGSEDGEAVEWTERALGELAHAGAIAVSAGGSASAREHGGRLAVELTLPAAPSR
jgi:hypothetical protein